MTANDHRPVSQNHLQMGQIRERGAARLAERGAKGPGTLPQAGGTLVLAPLYLLPGDKHLLARQTGWVGWDHVITE